MNIKNLFRKHEDESIAKDEFTLCKCLSCGHEQEIPSWLIDEIIDMNHECGIDEPFISGCYRCNKDTMVTMEHYNLIKCKNR